MPPTTLKENIEWALELPVRMEQVEGNEMTTVRAVLLSQNPEEDYLRAKEEYFHINVDDNTMTLLCHLPREVRQTNVYPTPFFEIVIEGEERGQ